MTTQSLQMIALPF